MKKTLSILSLSLITSLASFAVMANQADDIDVSAPFAREVPPGAPASASFMTLENKSAQAIKLTAANSTVAQTVELHTHTNDNGVMRMRKVEFIEIPASGTTELKPGGLHIMLIGPKQPLKMGQEVSVDLTFEDGSHKTVSMPVKSIKGMTMNHKMPMNEQNEMHNEEHNHEHMMEHSHEHMH
ncbi:transporter [Thiomicrorhabdus immobilis]|uniref:Transporter n=1 Tax=Thiomicrorhabdus immobilis TaxID=2791037 RepID=A0ABN6CX24_9GAMM|nr:copper chaperone PCu(A)C [Thiomicrorhabdus immobilis]BCN93682.1 transporter [Thiomicrorhabdus immobilis]